LSQIVDKYINSLEWFFVTNCR